jgi:alpha-galactosidase/6-phospho-beta-glucosidase family protein
MKQPKIVIVGGGSYSWGPQFIRDFAITPELSGCSIVLHDINPESLNLVYRLGEKIIGAVGGGYDLEKTLSLDEALTDADFVILTITTGGLEAMRHDLEIPEKYGIFQSVGDTVGPGGLARGLRNIPVVLDIARKMEEICPDAWLLNYTNPMTTLCRVVTRETNIKTIGLCHELMGVQHNLSKLFKAPEGEISARIGGINHLIWILDLKINGYDALSEFSQMADQILAGEILVDAEDTSVFADHFKVKSSLFQIYGALPAAGDRHLAEFFPFFITTDAERGDLYDFTLTNIEDRYQLFEESKGFILALLSGDLSLAPHLKETSGEAANKIIAAILGAESYTGPMNLPNQGQITSLPDDVIVETFATVEVAGVKPEHIGKLPHGINSVVRRHVDNQELVVEAAIHGDRKLSLTALVNDPLVTNLKTVSAMLDEMLLANQQYLPQFFNK